MTTFKYGDTNPEILYTTELDGVELHVACDVENIRNTIKSLRLGYENSKYGYIEYMGYNLDQNLTPEEYEENIDELVKEFEKRLTKEYLDNTVIEAKKKKNGTFHKGKGYGSYVLKNAEWYRGRNDGFTVYELEFITISDNLMLLRIVICDKIMTVEEYVERT